MAHLDVKENSSSSLVDTVRFDLCLLCTNTALFLCFVGRFTEAVLVVPLVLLDLERCRDFLHPSGP